MKAYRCGECGDSNTPCILLIPQDDHAPVRCPYEGDIGADWSLTTLDALTVGVRE